MCDVEGPDAYRSAWRRARKAHKCGACRETIRPRDRYRYTSGVWDHRPASFKHCVRCWLTVCALQAEGGPVDLELACGEVYDGEDAALHALAFMTPDEGQARVA